MENPYRPPAYTDVPVNAESPYITLTHIIYALHSLSILIGLTSAASVIGAFIFGLPSIIAVIINYARRSAVRGTFLESHFTWQIRTFWYAALWAFVGIMLWIVLAIVLIGFLIGPAILLITGAWVIYRVVRGWLALRDRRPMPV
jgi:uncharacterized membrane protein